MNARIAEVCGGPLDGEILVVDTPSFSVPTFNFPPLGAPVVWENGVPQDVIGRIEYRDTGVYGSLGFPVYR